MSKVYEVKTEKENELIESILKEIIKKYNGISIRKYDGYLVLNDDGVKSIEIYEIPKHFSLVKIEVGTFKDGSHESIFHYHIIGESENSDLVNKFDSLMKTLLRDNLEEFIKRSLNEI